MTSFEFRVPSHLFAVLICQFGISNYRHSLPGSFDSHAWPFFSTLSHLNHCTHHILNIGTERDQSLILEKPALLYVTLAQAQISVGIQEKNNDALMHFDWVISWLNSLLNDSKMQWRNCIISGLAFAELNVILISWLPFTIVQLLLCFLEGLKLRIVPNKIFLTFPHAEGYPWYVIAVY